MCVWVWVGVCVRFIYCFAFYFERGRLPVQSPAEMMGTSKIKCLTDSSGMVCSDGKVDRQFNSKYVDYIACRPAHSQQAHVTRSHRCAETSSSHLVLPRNAFRHFPFNMIPKGSLESCGKMLQVLVITLRLLLDLLVDYAHEQAAAGKADEARRV